MPKITLTTKSSVFLLMICLFSSITVGWISHVSSKNVLTQTFDRLTSLQAAKSDEIERYFEQMIHRIQVSDAFRDQLANSFGMDFRGSLERKGASMANTYLLTSGPILVA
jgi:hypothetical protein